MNSELTHESPEKKTLGVGYKVLGVVAILFGLATLKAGGAALLADGAERAAAGNLVPFVVIFNTVAGLFYVIAGLGILMARRWGSALARVLAVSTVLVFAALGIHIALGQPFETRTIAAMILRSAFWIVAALALQRSPVFKCKHFQTSGGQS